MQKGEVRSPVMVLLLSLITCGIYYLYWIYKVSEETQNYTGNKSLSPAVELLLVLFTCGIYGIYWFYKYGKLIAECHEKAGVTPEDNSILYLVLAICQLSIVNALIMQTSLNKAWEKNGIA